MLTQRYGSDIARLLVPHDRCRPCPTADDREAWLSLPEALRAEVVGLGESHRQQPWPPLPATLFMEYRREGNRSRYEREHFARRAALSALVVAECAEGAGRFVDDIVNGVWAICEESFWGVPAHNDGQALPDVERPIIDLFAAETAALLAWTHYLLEAHLDTVSPRVAARLRAEVERRALGPFLARDDFGWMGLRGQGVNNWNPWCTSNCLAAGLLLEADPTRRAAVVDKALRCLDRFIDPYPPDGGCDEGTGYWDRAGGALFDCLELLREASDGAIDVYGEPLIREIGRFLYREHIDGEWFVDFADGPARVRISSDLVHRFGRRIGDPALAALGACAHREGRAAGERVRGTLPRVLPALFNFPTIEADALAARPPYLRDVWLPAIQVMVAREHEGSPTGLYAAAKGGHNAESHNHNDIGQFIVYLDGRPVVVDAGVGTYTAQTFSARRYEVWTMRSGHHNLPTVRGVEQHAGAGFRARDVAYQADAGGAGMALEIGAAYPPEAGIAAWRRTVRLVRGEAAEVKAASGASRACGTTLRAVVEVEDDFRLTSATEDVCVHLLTAEEPVVAGPGRIEVGSGALRAVIGFDGEALAAAVEPLPLEDGRLRGVWGERLWRVTLRAQHAVAAGLWRVTVGRA